MDPGDVVAGRFRLEACVGAGGMGIVFRAEDLATGRPVAIKLLDASDDADLVRARREAAALMALAHPHVVEHIAHGTADGRLFIAMEWIEGTTLAERIATTGLTLGEAVVIAHRVGLALGAAHAAGFVHRDVKPSNILVVESDVARAKLIDFGVARVAGGGIGPTRTGMAIGTPAYMSPEQARGERMVTPAADVFALGCVLYECATGRAAFSGGHPAAVLAKIVFADPAPLQRLCPEAPLALRELVEHALAKEPGRRPADGTTFVRALEPLLGAVPRSPRRTSSALTGVTAPSPRGIAHCLVLATRGHPDDASHPPDPEQVALLHDAAHRHGAVLVRLDTGAVVARLSGASADAARRAAGCALAIRAVLPGWSVVIAAAESDIGEAADTGVAELAAESMRSVVGDDGPAHAGIPIDPRLAVLIDREFDVAAGPRPYLHGHRRA